MPRVAVKDKARDREKMKEESAANAQIRKSAGLARRASAAQGPENMVI